MKIRPFNLCAQEMKTIINYKQNEKQVLFSIENLKDNEFKYFDVGNTLFNDYTLPNFGFIPGSQGFLVQMQ